MMSNAISVIIPVYNGAEFLAQALDSVLAQTLTVKEIIVINDGSTDNTEAVALSYGTTIIYQSQLQKGPATARNQGLKLAQGEYVAFLDADDLWPPTRLAQLSACFQAQPTLDIVVGQTQAIQLNLADTVNHQLLGVAQVCFSLGSGLFKRSLFDATQIGLLDESLIYSEDMDWFNRAREKAVQLVKIEPVTLWYRRHSQSMTSNRPADKLQIAQVIKRSLDRRRNQGTVRPLVDYIEWPNG